MKIKNLTSRATTVTLFKIIIQMTWVKKSMFFNSNNDQDKESKNTTITHDREVPKKDYDSMEGAAGEENQEKAIKNREQACNTLRVSKIEGDIYSLV